MVNITKFILFFNKIKLKFIKNCFDIGVITSGIIKNKIFKLILNVILLNNLYHLFYNNFTYT